MLEKQFIYIYYVQTKSNTVVTKIRPRAQWNEHMVNSHHLLFSISFQVIPASKIFCLSLSPACRTIPTFIISLTSLQKNISYLTGISASLFSLFKKLQNRISSPSSFLILQPIQLKSAYLHPYVVFLYPMFLYAP